MARNELWTKFQSLKSLFGLLFWRYLPLQEAKKDRLRSNFGSSLIVLGGWVVVLVVSPFLLSIKSKYWILNREILDLGFRLGNN